MSGKLVEIDEIVPLLKQGWVACDIKPFEGDWRESLRRVK